jgi:hypothetical protein
MNMAVTRHVTQDYVAWLRDIVGDAAVFYSADGAGLSLIKCGKVDRVYAIVDFGTGNNLFLCSILS